MNALTHPHLLKEYANESWHHELLNAMNVGVLFTDPKGNILFANTFIQHLFKHLNTPVTSIYQPRWRMLDEHGIELAAHTFPCSVALNTGQAIVSKRVGLMTNTDTFVWYEISAIPVIKQERVTGLSVTLLNIDKTVQAEQADRVHTKFREELITLTQHALNTSLTEAFYQLIVDCAVKAIPGTQAASLIMQSEDGLYRFMAANGYDIEKLRTTYLLENELLTDIKNPNVQILYGFDNSDLEPERRDIIENVGKAEDIQVSLAVPLFVNNTFVACFHCDNFTQKDAFTDDAIDMARILCAQVGSLWQRFQLEESLRKEREQLSYQAHHDTLTDLPNRLLLTERIQQALTVANQQQTYTAICFLDLDNFKDLNDQHGHPFGDKVLNATAQRLRQVIRNNDTLARWGGDEFVLVLTNLRNLEDALAIVSNVQHIINTPYILHGQTIHLTTSIGLKLSFANHETSDDLIKHADIALYDAKSASKNTLRVYTNGMDARIRERHELIKELQQALNSNQFVLHYQPRIDLRSGHVTSVEALVRWQHPQRGLIMPDKFIDLAEESGFILQLGEHIIQLAAAQSARWKNQNRNIRIAVNISAKQLTDPGLIHHVSQTLEYFGLRGEDFEFEVTESTAMSDVTQSVTYLNALKNLGIKLALDDFGTAYSSLSALKNLPIDTLKIDRSFVNALEQTPMNDGKNSSVIKAIVALGQALNLSLVAEGVEHAYQLKFLQSLGCDEAQGYFFSKALPDVAAVSFVLPD